MREITTHKTHENDRQPLLRALGNVGAGGAEQDYELHFHEKEDWPMSIVPIPFISLDSGGVTNEALLAIVIDRLQGFQAGPYACAENQFALDYTRSALSALQQRTRERIARGVENQAKA